MPALSLIRVPFIALGLLTLAGCQTWTSGMTLPAPHYLEHPPQYVAPSPPFPLPRELATQEAAKPASPTPPGTAKSGPGMDSAPPTSTRPPVVRAVSPASNPTYPMGTTTGVLVTPRSPSSPGAAATAKAKLTVANVRKGEALLFTVSKEGDLTFVQKLAHGEAVDLDTTTGQRWAAVFAEQPHNAGHLVKGDGEVWLLRQPAPKAETTLLRPVYPSDVTPPR